MLETFADGAATVTTFDSGAVLGFFAGAVERHPVERGRGGGELSDMPAMVVVGAPAAAEGGPVAIIDGAVHRVVAQGDKLVPPFEMRFTHSRCPSTPRSRSEQFADQTYGIIWAHPYAPDGFMAVGFPPDSRWMM